MKRRLFERHGSITMFLCIVLASVIFLESIYISGAYRRKREVLLTEAVSHQNEQILSQFDRNCLNWYGVYSLKDVKAGSSVFEVMTSWIDGTEYSYELIGEFGNSDLKACISDYMRLRGIAFEGNELLKKLGYSISDIRSNSQLKGGGISEWLPTFTSLLESKSYVKSILDKLKSTVKDAGFGQKVDQFTGFLDDAREVWQKQSSAVIEYGDTSSTISMFDPSCLESLTNMFDKYMDADLPGFVDRMIMNEYAAFQFDSRIGKNIYEKGAEPETNMIGIPFEQIHSDNKSDLEYLLVGSDKEDTNQFAVNSLILGFRLILDMGSFMMDESKRQTALVIAEVLSLVIALVSMGTLIIDPFTLQYVILFIMAYIRAWTDMVKLDAGMSVPLFYHDSLPNMGGLTETRYRDYFRLALLFVPEEKLLSRMKAVIERDAGGKLYTGVRGKGILDGNTYQAERRYELYENK